MEDKSQTSLEYLIMLSLAIIIAAMAMVLTTRLLSIRTSIKTSIQAFRDKTLQIK